MKKDLKKLKRQYEDACNEYLEVFCEKQGMQNFGWVNNDVGNYARCNNIYIEMHDIKIDIDTKQQIGTIIQWINYKHLTGWNIDYTSYIEAIKANKL